MLDASNVWNRHRVRWTLVTVPNGSYNFAKQESLPFCNMVLKNEVWFPKVHVIADVEMVMVIA